MIPGSLLFLHDNLPTGNKICPQGRLYLYPRDMIISLFLSHSQTAMAFFVSGGFMSERENMELLNIDEAASYLKFSKTFLYRLTKEKRIPHVNFGRHLLFRKQDLYNWLGSMVTGNIATSFVVNK